MSRRSSNQFRRIKPSLQARIDYSHPLAPDLLCCPFNELVGPPRDLCHYIESSVSGTAPNWDGARIEYNGNGLHSFGDVTQFDGLSAFTVAFYARVDNFSTAMGVLNKRLTNTSQHAFSLGFSYSGGFPGRFSTSIGIGSGAGSATSYHFNTGSPADFGLWVAVYDSAAGDELRWRAWRNGAALTLGGTTFDSSAAIPDMSSPLVIGAVNSSAPLYFNGGIEYIYAWSGARPELSLPLLADPYCFLEDVPRRVYFIPSNVIVHQAQARALSFSAARANARVIRAAQARAQSSSAATALPAVIRAAQARAQSYGQAFALPHVVRGASVRCQAGASVSARLSAIRQLQARVQGRSVTLVGQVPTIRPGLRLRIGDSVKVRLVIGDSVKVRLVIGDSLAEGEE